ncbi:hypothetical protein MBANPS3_012445, partial [Mucor bainieri]
MEGNLKEVFGSYRGKNAGIIPRTMHDLFEKLPNESHVTVSMLELYTNYNYSKFVRKFVLNTVLFDGLRTQCCTTLLDEQLQTMISDINQRIGAQAALKCVFH